MKRSILILSIIPFLFSVCAAQWVIPTENQMNVFDECVFMHDDSTGWIGGTDGIILKTTDAGESWQLQHKGQEGDIVRVVRFLNAKTGFALASTYNQGFLYRTNDGGTTWVADPALRDTALTDSVTFSDITFTPFGDSLYIWLTGGGDTGTPIAYHQYVYVSKDTGRTWTSFSSLPSIPYLTVFKLLFFTPTFGVLSGGNVLCRTTDGGKTWDQFRIGPETDSDFYVFQFFNPDSGIFIGKRFIDASSYFLIGKTHDGAKTWAIDSTSTFTPLSTNIYFINENLGFSVSFNDGISQTTDSGMNWNVVYQGANGFPLFGIHSAGGNTVVAAGGTGKIVRSTDKGATWKDFTPPVLVNFKYVKYITPNLALALGEGVQLCLSYDSCKSWMEYDMPTSLDVHIAFGDSLNAWISDDSSRIYHSTNSGRSWQSQGVEPLGPPNPPLYGIHFLDDSIGCSVGQRGFVMATTDGGNTWFQATDRQTNDLYGTFVASKTRAWAVGAAGTILTSGDKLHNWTAQPCPVSTLLRSVAFSDTLNGRILGDDGVMLATTNGGATWGLMATPSTTLNAMSFPNSSDGWVVGPGGLIFRTVDGGGHWSSQSSGVTANLNGVDFIDPGHGVIVGDSGVVLTTSTGGITQVAPSNAAVIPRTMILEQNYPNPFNPSTMISYRLATGSMVTLTVYDLLGRQVETLVHERQNAGNHHVLFNAGNLSTGVYFYRLQAGSFVQTKKLMLLK